MDNDETFDEMSDEVVEAQEPDPTDLVKQVEFYKKRAERAEKQAVERKVRLGRFEAAAKHGIDVSDIPEYVKLENLDDFVERCVKPATSSAPAQTEAPTNDEAVTTEQVVSEAERNLAAVAKGSVVSGGPTRLHPEEALARAKADPAWLAAELAAGRNPLPRLSIGKDKESWES